MFSDEKHKKAKNLILINWLGKFYTLDSLKGKRFIITDNSVKYFILFYNNIKLFLQFTAIYVTML